MIADVKKSAEQKMQKTVEALKTDLGKVRTGRAHTGLLDHIMVDYYGTPTPLKQVANVTSARRAHHRRHARTRRSMAPVIEKAIRDSDLGLNPVHHGRHRARADAGADRRAAQGADQGGQARGGERASVAVRNVRRDANTHLKDLLKTEKVSEDDERRAQDEVQKLTDRTSPRSTRLLHAKEADLMAV